MWGGTDEAESIKAIQAALEAGINLIDTAPVYGFGVSEEIVGKAIAGRRDKVILATKCGIVWDREEGEYYFDSNERHPGNESEANKKVYKCLKAGSIQRELEASLRRLRVEAIDLYQTHRQDATTAIKETMETLMRLKKEGKIRAIGVSNATAEQMADYDEYGQLDSGQERFSMLDRQIETRQLAYCRRHGTAMLAYSPLEQGLLTGKIGPARVFDAGDQRRYNPKFQPVSLQKIDKMLGAFQAIARGHDATLAQLAIAWTISRPGISHALCGARRAEQAWENAGAGDLQLSAEELRVMDAAIAAYEA